MISVRVGAVLSIAEDAVRDGACAKLDVRRLRNGATAAPRARSTAKEGDTEGGAASRGPWAGPGPRLRARPTHAGSVRLHEIAKAGSPPARAELGPGGRERRARGPGRRRRRSLRKSWRVRCARIRTGRARGRRARALEARPFGARSGASLRKKCDAESAIRRTQEEGRTRTETSRMCR